VFTVDAISVTRRFSSFPYYETV